MMKVTSLKATLRVGDHISYRCGTPDDETLPVQPWWDGPYSGSVVGVNAYTVDVREDGWWGRAPLYRVFFGHIIASPRGCES